MVADFRLVMGREECRADIAAQGQSPLREDAPSFDFSCRMCERETSSDGPHIHVWANVGLRLLCSEGCAIAYRAAHERESGRLVPDR